MILEAKSLLKTKKLKMKDVLGSTKIILNLHQLLMQRYAELHKISNSFYVLLNDPSLMINFYMQYKMLSREDLTDLQQLMKLTTKHGYKCELLHQLNECT